MASRPRRGRLGFVPVRFGDDVVGGAEMLVREMADGFAARGWPVDVLTGCTRDAFLEVAHYLPGESVRPSGAHVRRFPSVASASRAERVLGNRALAADEPMDAKAQYRWCNDDVRSPELFAYLLDHAHEYRAIVFAPYLYWPAVAGSIVAPERSILMPCLHDEPTARLSLYDRMFRDSRGLWFLTDPEATLARALRPELAPSAVIGSGVSVPDGYDPARFRRERGLDGPFVLYAGRRESGKGFDELVGQFVTAAEASGSELRLVVAGPGRVHLDERARRWVVDVGVLSERDRDDAMAAAAAVVQPSPYESFSRTMMEAWLAGTVVIANAASDVSAWHCERSGGGVTYRGAEDLATALAAVQSPDADALGARGREYVLAEYTWPAVLDRAEAVLDEWLPEAR